MGAMDRFLGGANGQEIPVGYRWTFANSTTRAATNDYLTAAAYASTDIGKEALQQSDNTLWLLTGTTPTWTAIGSATTNASLLTSGTVADARLSGNVPLLNAANAFTSHNTITSDADNQTPLIVNCHSITQSANAFAVTLPSYGNLLTLDNQGNLRLANNLNCSIIGITGTIAIYNNVATVAWGNPAIYGSGRLTGQTAAATLATYTVGGSDGSFLISANVLVTTRTTYSFTVNCNYTDEANTSRSVQMSYISNTGTVSSTITSTSFDTLFNFLTMRIRAKAGTAITLVTVGGGGFTSVVYNAEADIAQVK